MTYRDELTKAMTLLGQRDDAIFMGQAVAFPGTGMYGTLEGVPMDKRLELPVFEDVQLGMAIGMSLAGLLPVCIYPRINFLLLAMNQLVLHLDKLPLYGNGYKPKVIIRTAIAHNEPMDPGVQHLGEFGRQLEGMLQTVDVRHMGNTQHILKHYERAVQRDGSSLLIERMACYDDP